MPRTQVGTFSLVPLGACDGRPSVQAYGVFRTFRGGQEYGIGTIECVQAGRRQMWQVAGHKTSPDTLGLLASSQAACEALWQHVCHMNWEGGR